MPNINPGGIYRVIAPTAPTVHAALVLTTSVDNTTRLASVTLLSPDVELGTSDDLLLDHGRSKLRYPVLIQADVFGYLSSDQFDRLLGKVHPRVLASLAALRNDDQASHTLAGPPLTERTDPRWAFKLAELKRMRTLTASYTCEPVDSIAFL